MSKLVQALLSGIFFTFLLDFLFFLGIFLNYIQFLEIDIYYNILFADNQCILLFLFLSVLIGYLLIYVKNVKVTLVTISSFFIITSLGLIPSLGYKIGEMFLMKKNVTYKEAKHTFIGDSYYDGRKTITFFDYQLKKVIILKKKNLI